MHCQNITAVQLLFSTATPHLPRWHWPTPETTWLH
jgi:hypothetical protein